MKATVLLLIIGSFLVTASSCGKDKDNDNIKKPVNYAEISLADIKAEESLLSADKIPASNAGGLIWKPGDVFIFKAHGGRFGKFRVVSIDMTNNYELIIAAVIYNNDGSIAEQTEGLGIRGTWNCNLEVLVEETDPLQSDFQWERINNTNTNLSPQNGAKFLKYVF